MGAANKKLFDQFVLIACGHTAFQLMCSGVELGIFSLLAKRKKMSREKIAAALDLAERPARILITGLTCLGLLEADKKGNVSNSKMTKDYLLESSPHNMVHALSWQKHIVYPGEVDFLESLKKNENIGLRNFPGPGSDLYTRLTANPGLEKKFHDSMRSISQSANRILANKVSFAGTKHLVDIGGGDGSNAITLAKANPKMKATVYDSQSVCAIAKKNIMMNNMADRVGTYVGDFFVDGFPQGMDCALVAHILSIWAPEKNIKLLKRLYNALPKGGKAVIFNMMGNDDLSGPMTSALGSPYFLSVATGEGMLYSWKEYEGFLLKAGFKRTVRKSLPNDHGVLIGIK